MKKQPVREDGQLLILSPDNGSAAALSALPNGFSSESKDKKIMRLLETSKKNPERICSRLSARPQARLLSRHNVARKANNYPSVEEELQAMVEPEEDEETKRIRETLENGKIIWQRPTGSRTK